MAKCAQLAQFDEELYKVSFLENISSMFGLREVGKREVK